MRRSRVVLRPCMIWIAVQLAVGLAILAAEPPNTPAQTAAPSVGKDSSGFLYAIQENGKWGFIDRTGKIRIEPQFDAVDGFSDGLARVEGPGQVFSP